MLVRSICLRYARENTAYAMPEIQNVVSEHCALNLVAYCTGSLGGSTPKAKVIVFLFKLLDGYLTYPVRIGSCL